MDERLKHELEAHSEKTSLEKLQSQGKKRLRVIKAGAIVEMIEEAVQRALRSSDTISPEEAERLIAESRTHFRSALKSGQRAANPADASDTELDRLRAENDKLRANLDQGEANPAADDGLSSQLLMHMMKEIASIKANSSQQAGEAGGDAMSAAIDKMASSMNDRLEQLGKKMGISSAVDAADINFEALFDDMEVRQTTGSGIAANLARLKKLKGGGD